MYPFVAAPNFPVVNDFEASSDCMGVFLNRADVAVAQDAPRPTTLVLSPEGSADQGLSRLFLYDPIGQWVNLSSCEEYNDECDFYHCHTLETAEDMLNVWLFEDEPILWIWKPIPDAELSAFLGVEADWSHGYSASQEDAEEPEDELGNAVFEALDNATKNGYDMFVWSVEAVAKDLTNLDQGLENWDPGDIVPYVRAWREANSPPANKTITISKTFEICELNTNKKVKEKYDNEEIGFIDFVNLAIDPDRDTEEDSPQDFSAVEFALPWKSSRGTIEFGHYLMGLYDDGKELAFCLAMDMASEVRRELDKTDWNLEYVMYVQGDEDNGTLFILSK